MTPTAAPRRGNPAIAALTVLILIAVLAWASRGNLNADGVSYLDLAERLRVGDGAGFVQAYWSPAYPLLLSVLLSVTGATGHRAAELAHLLNFLIAVAAVALIWHAARHRHRTWGLLLLTALLVASARTMRVDAVTPDLLLLLTVTGFGIELLRPQGWRGIPLGCWAGFAFLAKTSSWPWLIVSGLLLAWHAWPLRAVRRQLGRAVAIAAAPVLLWGLLISLDAGRLTIGAAAGNSACWYLRACDGRSPDTHTGNHEAYSQWPIAGDTVAKVATFSAGPWTYQPWGDPDVWQRGIITQGSSSPTIVSYLGYVLRQLGRVLVLWVPLTLILVILPAVSLQHGKPKLGVAMLRAPPGILAILGGAGVAQFIAVHAEPRLIAPFVLLLTLGVVTWASAGEPRRALGPLAQAALVIALAIGGWHVRDQLRITASSEIRVQQLEQQHPEATAPHRVVVIGKAFPMLADLYRARAVVVAQVMAPGAETLQRWPALAQQALVERIKRLGATTLWISRDRDNYTIVRLR